MANLKEFLFEQFKTNTGTHFLDSGGNDGRRWQKNADKSIKDFDNEEYVTVDVEGLKDTADAVPTVSTWHYLNDALELDELCHEFNSIPCKNWDSSKADGLSIEGQDFLEAQGFKIQDAWNSYNYESNLDYTLQGASVLLEDSSNFEFPEYILLQIHLGADVRGGYTDAKLYKVNAEYFSTNPDVYGNIDGVEVDTRYNGYNLTDIDGSDVPLKTNSKIELDVSV
jgi:hypothetical protein